MWGTGGLGDLAPAEAACTTLTLLPPNLSGPRAAPVKEMSGPGGFVN